MLSTDLVLTGDAFLVGIWDWLWDCMIVLMCFLLVASLSSLLNTIDTCSNSFLGDVEAVTLKLEMTGVETF